MRYVVAIFLFFCVQNVAAQAVVPTQTIRAKEIIQSHHVIVVEVDSKGAVTDPAQIIGMEARVALYPDRRIFARDVAPAALIARNQTVSLIFKNGGLEIEMEGRALKRAAIGETVRVLNPASRMTVSGRVLPNGKVEVRN